jgi:hypothetical protein
MKKIHLRTILLASILLSPVPTMAEVNIGINIPLPPLVVFASPPEVVVIPETYVYVVPDSDVDIFFYDGWWWRPWEGRWYRSRHYGSGWRHYQRVPSFYARIPRGWRNDYREHRWGGRPWNYQPIPHQQVERNWSGWKKNKHWEKQQTWGVQGLKPRSQQPSKAVQPKSQAKPQSGEVRPQRSQPQQREAAPQQSKPAQGKPEKAQTKPDKGQGKPDKGEEDKKDRRQEERR